MLMTTSYALEEYARARTEAHLAEAERERLIAMSSPSRGLWVAVRDALRALLAMY